MGDGATRLRQLLEGPGLVDAAGAHDVISAQMVAKAGFPVVYVGGAATAASNFGLPDVGLVPPDFFVDQAGRVAAVVSAPAILDLDDGGGNPLRVVAFRAVADTLAELKSLGEVRSVQRPSYGETGRAVDSDEWGRLAVRYGM
jgi:2-methylisocitrate lyase-like PEP mutase family enzyme